VVLIHANRLGLLRENTRLRVSAARLLNRGTHGVGRNNYALQKLEVSDRKMKKLLLVALLLASSAFAADTSAQISGMYAVVGMLGVILGLINFGAAFLSERKNIWWECAVIGIIGRPWCLVRLGPYVFESRIRQCC
jgi:hypothetical protein